MATTSMPHPSVNGDRQVSAAMVQAQNRAMYTSGWMEPFVFVQTAPSKWNIVSGAAMIDGCFFTAENEAVDLSEQSAGSVAHLVARASASSRQCAIMAVPSIIKQVGLYDLVLGKLTYNASSGWALDRTVADGKAIITGTPQITNAMLEGNIDAAKLKGAIPAGKLACGLIRRSVSLSGGGSTTYGDKKASGSLAVGSSRHFIIVIPAGYSGVPVGTVRNSNTIREALYNVDDATHVHVQFENVTSSTITNLSVGCDFVFAQGW